MASFPSSRISEFCCKKCQQRFQDRSDRHGQQKRFQPALQASDEKVVNVNLGENRNNQVGEGQAQCCQKCVKECKPASSQPFRQSLPDAWFLPALFECRVFLKDQNDAREGLIEFLVGNRAAAGSRIVEENFAFLEAFQHNEVVEVPEDNHGQRQVSKLGRFLFETLCLQTVISRCLQEVAGFASIPRDTTGQA
jgi:hypothetical protein